MRRLMRFAMIAGMLMLVLAASAQRAGEGAGLISLNRLVGKYPFESKLWAKQPLNRRLHQLLQSDYKRLIENMQVSGPLQKENGILFITGNKTHDGGENDACLLIDPKRDVINVMLNLNKKLKTCKERKTTLPLPRDAKAWLENVKMFQ